MTAGVPGGVAKRGTVVAIDGPAGAGKTTLSRRLARALGLPHLNTGTMYRALARAALDRGADVADGPALAALAGSLGFSMEEAGDPPGVLLGRRSPGPELTSAEVESVVSQVSAHPEVREVLRAEQRRLAAPGAVVEGRDIGTVVFPDANVKVFVVADPLERASRRQAERGSEDEGLVEALARRDRLDARTNPLVPAPDAHEVDTSGRAEDDVFAEVMALVRDALGGQAPGGPKAARAGVPVVAIVGRQNVGKSTLLNRLLGAREAIAAEQPGVTRDRVEVPVEWRGRRFSAIDTGGYVHRPTGIDALVIAQADRAAAEADVVLLVVDATVGVQEEDATLAERLRRARAPVVLVANKVDSDTVEPEVASLYRLGLGDPVAVSALHGRGAGELLDRVVDLLPEVDEVPQADAEAVFSIVGRPNVGKSSLFNRLVGQERSVVYEDAGTTRDAVDSVVQAGGGLVRFVDTAGFRRPSRAEGLEYYGYTRAVRAIDRSHVAGLVVAAHEGVTTEDRRIAARVAEAGRGLVVVANKWDLVEREERAGRFEEIREGVAVFPGAPVLRTSALTGAGVGKVLPSLIEVHERWTRRVSTAEANRVLHEAQGEHPPPRTAGRLLYGTQVSTGPPRFVIFTGGPVPPTYRRFLENRLRAAFGFEGVPIRLSIRPRKRRRR
ncbi:MAG: ribosome biogenesis GTPase Der [Actinomycetota bacterium]